MKTNILANASAHPLHVVLRELKWGRAAEDQRFLLWLADIVEKHGVSNIKLNELADEIEDRADWWKQKPLN